MWTNVRLVVLDKTGFSLIRLTQKIEKVIWIPSYISRKASPKRGFGDNGNKKAKFVLRSGSWVAFNFISIESTKFLQSYEPIQNMTQIKAFEKTGQVEVTTQKGIQWIDLTQDSGEKPTILNRIVVHLWLMPIAVIIKNWLGPTQRIEYCWFNMNCDSLHNFFVCSGKAAFRLASQGYESI